LLIIKKDKKYNLNFKLLKTTKNYKMARGRKPGSSGPRKRRRRETWALYIYKVLK